MEIELLTGVATAARTYDRGEVVFWEDKEDALRMIKAGAARPPAKKKKNKEDTE
jgi:hypothetical protein